MRVFPHSKIIDISPPIHSQLAVWPGDIAFRRQMQCSLKNGANIDLSSMETTVHLGAHADAPAHYLKNGRSIDEVPLENYLGPAQVIEVNIPRGQRIRPQDLGCDIQAPRVLFKTNSYPDPNIFNQDFNSCSAALIDFLAERGILLIGIDTPSVDPFDDKILESHQALARAKMLNLEGLVLTRVVPGLYQLIALPLNLKGFDASPVRAILTELSKD